MRRFVLLTVGLALCLAMTACTRLEVVGPKDGGKPGELPKQKLATRDALPAELGDLVGVTSSADHPNWAQAWFMRPDKSIAVVWINSRTGYMLEDMLIIPRR
ncbi:MAG: hypothetical protein AAB011_06330 [Candidatus Eisenbacteria bacterium]